MSKELKTSYVKRTQRDYTMAFKLGVVKEVESGQISVTGAKRKNMGSKVGRQY